MVKLFNGNSLDIMNSNEYKELIKDKKVIIVTDPPFNVNYHYSTYKDNLPETEYYNMLKSIVGGVPSVVIHYPESLHKLSLYIGKAPEKVVTWVYNSNTAKQHRDIAFYDIKPDFTQVKQPYKNPNDKRIKERIKRGILGGRLYDWWNINQVKNVSKDKTMHPCQMPQQVLDNIIGILPKTKDTVIVDPFMGTGTTGLACIKYNVDFIGVELSYDYYNIAKERLNSNQLSFI